MANKLIYILLGSIIAIGCSDKEQFENSWSVYRADQSSSNYSPHDQINTTNVSSLSSAWTFEMKDTPMNSRPGVSQCTPIVIDGILYTMSAKAWLYALDATSGRQIWSFDPFNGGDGGGTSRGVSYWKNDQDKRILFAAGDHLFSVDAVTGKPDQNFGINGKVDLKIGLRDNPKDMFVAMTSPGIVYDDLIIVGCRLQDLYGSPPGYIRAYNVKTGELTWTFHTIPLPGEPGYETWPKEAYKTAGGVNNWAGLSLDTERDIVFASLGSPSYDFYGADRIGANLYGNCVLALKASTGEYVWHYQTVHHDLWDYDLPAPPNLVTVEKDGQTIDAVAQVTKQGFVFVLDRESGEPIFPIEEREVPKSNMPGEEAWPTQPYPTKPKPYSRQEMTIDDLSNYSKADNNSLRKKFNEFRYEGMFTPPDLNGTVMLPGTRGGAQWGGASFDPVTGMMYIRSMDAIELITIVKQDISQTNSTSMVAQGTALYQNYCASCHGVELQGNGAIFPALTALKSRLTKEVSKGKISKGIGQMPGYASMLNENEIESILAFLYEEEDRSVVADVAAKSLIENPQYLNTTGYTTWTDPSGNPALQPPWGMLHALNLSTGEYEWQITLGNEPSLQLEVGLETGLEGKSGPVVTSGDLIFIAGAEDQMFRAIKKSSGELLWQSKLPAIANATACTYQVKGKQYVVISVGGTIQNPSGSVMAFALP